MLKLIFSDLDNTLLTSEKTVSNKTVSFIKKLESKGIKFIINTGRLPYNVNYLGEYLDISNLVCGNGSYIKINNQVIYDRPCIKEDVYKVIEYCQSINVPPRVFFSSGVCSNVKVSTLPSFKVDVLDHSALLEKITREDVYKVCFLNDDHKILDDITNFIHHNLNNSVAELSNPHFLECHHKDASKGKGIDKVCTYLNINKDEVLAMGDNENDLSMFNRGYHSGAPINSSASVKEIVEYISDFDFDQDAVIDIIKHFM